MTVQPSSQISVSSKIFEKILYLQLKSIIEKNNIIPDHQYGFRATYAQYYSPFFGSRFKMNLYVSAVFSDESQAFGRILHSDLLLPKSMLPRL